MSNRNRLSPKGTAIAFILWILLFYFQCNGTKNISEYMRAVREFRGF